MKVDVALKKFPFLKRLNLSDAVLERVANHIVRTIKGSSDVHVAPVASKICPVEILTRFDEIFDSNKHSMNDTLLEMERANRSKFGPRSISLSWSHRVADLRASFACQIKDHIPRFNFKPGDGSLVPVSLKYACENIKSSSNSGLPYLEKKGKIVTDLYDNFDVLKDRKDPCMLFTRTTEGKKTRNVWGYPFVDTVYEMMFYVPLLILQRGKFYRAALRGPEFVDECITEMIKTAIRTDRILYSVDFKGFDASILCQYIGLAFNYIKSCFEPVFHIYLDEMCVRVQTIAIVTPSGIWEGFHGMPSGSTLTNELDSIIQLGIACVCSFILDGECQIQGDDGVYIMSRDDIPEFEAAFKYAGLKLEKSKSHIASNYVMFCQKLYHTDYINDAGHIGGIYSLYRALNRILFQEKYVNLKKIGLSCKDYYSVRCLTILENCKYHPLFEEFVRFIMTLEKYNLDVSDDSILKFCSNFKNTKITTSYLNSQYGSDVSGIYNWESYKLVRRIIAEEELLGDVE